jgi:putative transport protein
MHWLQHLFQAHPELAIFLALCIGFYVGGLSIKGFSLGTVTGVLLAGMLIGQWGITISGHVEAVFFSLFLFAVGYNGGPQFFRSIKKGGLRETFFAIVLCATSLGVVWLIALLMHLDKGQAAGLLAGSQTVTPAIGVATDTIERLGGIGAPEKQKMLDAIPVCYAITYIFGTAGATWLLTVLGLPLLGGAEKVKAECRLEEERMGGNPGAGKPGVGSALATTSFNAYRVADGSIASGKTIRELELEFLKHGNRLFVRRVRRDHLIYEATPGFKMQVGDIIVLNGRRQFLISEKMLGVEVTDDELLNFPVSTIKVYATKNEATNLSLKELALKEFMYGVIVQSITRGGIKIPMYVEVPVQKGDYLELVGLQKDVFRAVGHIGYAEVPTNKTNMVFVGLAIVVGVLIGAFSFQLGSFRFSFGSIGILFSGLFFGWLCVQKPFFGKIPPGVDWFMNNVGLAVFIAIAGIHSGPKFAAGIKEMGAAIFFAGVVASALPIFLGLLIGRFIFRIHPAYVLGCIAGTTVTTALSVVQENIKSDLPTLGYTVAYAVNNILMFIGTILLVTFLK